MGGKASSGTCGYKYYLGMHLVLCHGPIDKLLDIRFADRVAWSGSATGGTISVNAPELFGGDDREGGVSGSVDLLMGDASQTTNSYLVSQLGSPLPAFRGVVSLVFRHFYVGNNPYIKNPAFKVQRIHIKTDGSAQWYDSKAAIGNDLNPVHIIRECLTNNIWGLGYSDGDIDDTTFQSVADTLYTENFGLSLIWNQQSKVEDFIQTILDHIDGKLYLDQSTGKFAMKLIRDDYDPATLTVFDETNVIAVDSFERRGWGETINEVSVVYKDENTNKDTTVTLHNIGNIQMQGGVASTTKHYSGIRNASLAMKVCMRDLHVLSAPLSKLKLRVNREGWFLGPGDVFKFSWDKFGLSSVIFRVATVDYGHHLNNEITVTAVEDVFGLPSGTYTSPQPPAWSSPNNSPQPCPYQQVVEATYWDVQMNVSKADIQQLGPDFGFVVTQGSRPSSDTYDYKIYTDSGSGYEFKGNGVPCPVALLGEDLLVDSTVTGKIVTITDGVGLDKVKTDTYAYIGSEIVAIRAIDTAANTITIDRGILDTLPQAHSTGDVIFFAENRQGFDRTERTAGESVSVKLLPRTGLGTLDISNATALSLTLNDRYQRPYPPGNFKINTVRYADKFSGDLTFSWSHRDRTQQTAYLVAQNETDIGPEANVSYSLILKDEDNAAYQTNTGLTVNSYTLTWNDDKNNLGKKTYAVDRIFLSSGGDVYTLSLDFANAVAKDTGVYTTTTNGTDTVDISMSSGGGSSDGSGLEIPFSGLTTKQRIRFKRTQNGSWYDDDDTDAQFLISYFPGVNVGAIAYHDGTWEYHMAYGTTGVYGLRLSFGRARTNFNAYALTTGGVSTYLTRTDYAPASAIWDGTKEIVIELIPNGANTDVVAYEDGVKLCSWVWGNAIDSSGVLQIHLHDYANTATENIQFTLGGADTVVPELRGNDHISYTLNAVNDTTGLNNWMGYSGTIRRVGYGFNYGEAYGD